MSSTLEYSTQLRSGRHEFALDRPDLLVHALAQLPERLEAKFASDAPRQRLELLARAYGVDSRIGFSASPGSAGSLVDLSGEAAVTEATTIGQAIEGLRASADPPSTLNQDDSCFKRQRVAIVTNIPAPYRIPLFNGIAARMEAAEGKARVLFLSEADDRRPWMAPDEERRFEFEILRSVRLPLGERGTFAPRGLERSLNLFQPTLLLVGGFSPAVAGRVAAYARRQKIPFGIWSGDVRGTKSAQSRLRHQLRRRIARRAAFGIVYGYEAGEYLRGLCSTLPFTYGRNTSVSGLSRPRPVVGPVVRLVAIGDMASARKGLDILVDAMKLEPGLPCALRIVGGGRMLAALRQRAGGDARIRFLGPLPPADVRKELDRADVFLFPSREEVFGLALVEAMQAGCAVVSSPVPGVVGDLCVDRHNAYLVSDHDPKSWALAISRLVSEPLLRAELGERANETVGARWTMEHSVDAFIAGLRLGTLVRAPRE